MHIDRIFALADLIEQSKNFNMASCDTCIAGHCPTPSGRKYPTLSEAARFLGLQEYQELFLTRGAQMANSERAIFLHDPHEAARVLRNLAITGKVDWSVAFSKEPEVPSAKAKVKVKVQTPALA